MLEGIIRESIGKVGTKALRKDGYLIANIYGRGLENINAAFKVNDYIRAVRNKDTLAFAIKVADKELNVVVQEYQIDPLRGDIKHVDFMVAQPNVITHYHVPVLATGSSVGVKNGGMLNISKKRLRVKGAIENIPNKIEIDVTALDVDNAVLVRELPEIPNVKFTDADRVSVLGIIKAK